MLKNFPLTVAAVATVLTTTVTGAMLAPSATAGSTTNFQGVGAKVSVYNINFDGEKFIGQILNRTGKTLHFLKLHYRLLDGQGQLVDVGSVYILEDQLKGSQNGAFRVRVWDTGATNLVITSAEWLD